MSYEYTDSGFEQENAPPKSKKTRNCCLITCGGCGCFTLVVAILCLAGYYIGGSLFRSGVSNETILNALQAYYMEHGEYPPAYSTDENGDPLHSWRVLILPYFDENVYGTFFSGPLPGEIYGQIRLDEPWDSEHNRLFASQMPKCYLNSTLKEEGRTNLQMIVGERCISDGANARTIEEIRGVGHPVILFVEAFPSVEWMAPKDLSHDDLTANGIVSADAGIPGLACPHGIFGTPMGMTAASNGQVYLYVDESDGTPNNSPDQNYITLERLREYATMGRDAAAPEAKPLDNPFDDGAE